MEKEDKNILGHLFIVCKNLAKELKTKNLENSNCKQLISEKDRCLEKY